MAGEGYQLGVPAVATFEAKASEPPRNERAKRGNERSIPWGGCR